MEVDPTAPGFGGTRGHRKGLTPHEVPVAVSTNPAFTSVPEPMGWEDAVSGLEGPDFWRRILVAELARSARYARPLTVVLMELVGLEMLAEAWGPEVARHAVRETAQCLRRVSRTSDYATRLGVARFGVVLTETDEIAAINFVERVRADMPGSLPRGARGLLFGFGWASPAQNEAAEHVVRRAEQRLRADLRD